MQKLTLKLSNAEGTVLDVWNSDDQNDEELFQMLGKTKAISSLTAANIRDAMSSVYWVKETRVYLINATSEADAEEIFNDKDFDQDWGNHEVEVGLEG